MLVRAPAAWVAAPRGESVRPFPYRTEVDSSALSRLRPGSLDRAAASGCPGGWSRPEHVGRLPQSLRNPRRTPKGTGTSSTLRMWIAGPLARESIRTCGSERRRCLTWPIAVPVGYGFLPQHAALGHDDDSAAKVGSQAAATDGRNHQPATFQRGADNAAVPRRCGQRPDARGPCPMRPGQTSAPVRNPASRRFFPRPAGTPTEIALRRTVLTRSADKCKQAAADSGLRIGRWTRMGEHAFQGFGIRPLPAVQQEARRCPRRAAGAP